MSLRLAASAAVFTLAFVSTAANACTYGECYDKVRVPDVYRTVDRPVVVRPGFRAVSELLDSLGLEPESSEFDRRYPAQPTGATAVPGLYLAGNVTDPMASVASAAAQGTVAASAVHADLLAADTADRLAQTGTRSVAV